MAIGIGEGSDQTAALAIAVIGGLVFSTISTLLFLPMIYNWIVGKKQYQNSSLDPEDSNSKYYEPSN
jgi:Cu/Ag efflux pump CusA